MIFKTQPYDCIELFSWCSWCSGWGSSVSGLSISSRSSGVSRLSSVGSWSGRGFSSGCWSCSRSWGRSGFFFFAASSE